MKSLVVLAFLLLLAAPLSLMQAAAGNDVPAYNPAQEQTFTGTIQEVKEYQCPVSGAIGSHIAVSGGSETVEVHVAPAAFLRQYGIVLKVGDRVRITGIKFVFDGKPA